MKAIASVVISTNEYRVLMNLKYIVHIGRHKTGTSSLQEFLYQNRVHLNKWGGLHYPRSGVEDVGGHHCFSRGLVSAQHQMRGIPGIRANQWIRYVDQAFKKEYDALGAEIAENSDSIILMSSEGFQNVNIHIMTTLFPPDESVLVMYLREQLEYLVSSYAQIIQNTKCSDSFYAYENSVLINYEDLIERILYRYDRSRLKLKIYERENLCKNDIRIDFLNTVRDLLMAVDRDKHIEAIESDLERSQALSGSAGDGWVFTPRHTNPSFGGGLLEFKRILNAVTHLGEYELLERTFPPLQDLALKHRKFRAGPLISESKQRAVREKYVESNRAVFRECFGGKKEFRCKAYNISGSPYAELSSKDMNLIWNHLHGVDSDFVASHYDNFLEYFKNGNVAH